MPFLIEKALWKQVNYPVQFIKLLFAHDRYWCSSLSLPVCCSNANSLYIVLAETDGHSSSNTAHHSAVVVNL